MKTFSTNVIYFLLEYWGDIKLCYIGSNRKVNKQIDAKLTTCKSVGMQTPALFCNPKVVSDAGYTLKDVKTDKEIPKDQIETYDLAIYEGHTRFWAWFNSRVEKEDGLIEEAFKFMFLYREFKDSEEFKKAYHEINLNQEKTTVRDFSRDLLATGGDNEVLKSYNAKISRGLVAKAAGYATYNREFTKDDVIKLQKGEAPNYMATDKLLKYTDRVFVKVTEAFGCKNDSSKMHKALKGSFVWKFNAGKLKDVEKNENKLEEVTQKLEKLYSTLPSSSLFAISEAKATDSQTKEKVIESILQNLYDNI